jgi:hypothetical protein
MPEFEGIIPNDAELPQPTIVPSAFSASAKSSPADIWITSVAAAGIFSCPEELLPQATTVPSDRRANENCLPAEIATTSLNPDGTVV